MKISRFQATVFVLALLPSAVLAQPRAVVVEPVIDVGAVSRGTKIEHSFEVRNEGDKSLTIREVQPACGCTVAEFDRTIAPGATGRIEAVVDTKDFRGPIAKAVKVFTSDPENARFDLVIKADVRSQIETRPGYARMVVIQGEPTESIRQWMWATDGTSLDVEKVTSPYPFLTVSHREATPEERKQEGPERQWLIDFKLAADAPVGALADHVIVRTNHPEQRDVKIPVSGFVRAVVSVRPRIADFGQLELTGPFSAFFDVQNLGSDAIRVVAATTDLSGAETGVEEIEAGKRYRIEVKLQPAMATGSFQGKLEIQTSSKRLPTVEVELSGTIL